MEGSEEVLAEASGLSLGANMDVDTIGGRVAVGFDPSGEILAIVTVESRDGALPRGVSNFGNPAGFEGNKVVGREVFSNGEGDESGLLGKS